MANNLAERWDLQGRYARKCEIGVGGVNLDKLDTLLKTAGADIVKQIDAAPLYGQKLKRLFVELGSGVGLVVYINRESRDKEYLSDIINRASIEIPKFEDAVNRHHLSLQKLVTSFVGQTK